MLNQLRRRKWNWLGHTLRQNEVCIAKQALQWTAQGYRDRGRPNTCRKDLKKEMRTAGFKYSCRKMELAAKDRAAGWRQVVCNLCSTGSEQT